MATAIWKPGRRLFTTAACCMLLTAILHTLGNAVSGPPMPGEAEAFAAMSAFHIPLGMGMNPSLKAVYWDLVFTMSISFFGLALVNLVLAAAADVPARVIRRVGYVNAIWAAAFTALAYHCQIPPALISGAVILTFVVADLLINRTSTDISPHAAS